MNLNLGLEIVVEPGRRIGWRGYLVDAYGEIHGRRWAFGRTALVKKLERLYDYLESNRY